MYEVMVLGSELNDNQMFTLFSDRTLSVLLCGAHESVQGAGASKGLFELLERTPLIANNSGVKLLAVLLYSFAQSTCLTIIFVFWSVWDMHSWIGV